MQNIPISIPPTSQRFQFNSQPALPRFVPTELPQSLPYRGGAASIGGGSSGSKRLGKIERGIESRFQSANQGSSGSIAGSISAGTGTAPPGAKVDSSLVTRTTNTQIIATIRAEVDKFMDSQDGPSKRQRLHGDWVSRDELEELRTQFSELKGQVNGLASMCHTIAKDHATLTKAYKGLQQSLRSAQDQGEAAHGSTRSTAPSGSDTSRAEESSYTK